MKIRLLGAERAAAVSFAQAWPEHRFLFVTDEPVVDGWDLPNVSLEWGSPADEQLPGEDCDITVEVCGRWASHRARRCGETTDLLSLLSRVSGVLDGRIVPTTTAPPAHGNWQAKGRLWHRPDAVVVSGAGMEAEVPEPYGCGLVYQPVIAGASSIVATGRRLTSGALRCAVFRIHGESLARYDVLQVGESIEDSEISKYSAAALDALAHVGYFTLNWLRTDTAVWLSSLRLVPREVQGTMRQGGVDCLAPGGEAMSLRPGHRFIVESHYSSYRRLSP